MSYLPYALGGAALGYAAARRGRGRRVEHDDWEWKKVKGSFPREQVTGPWGTKTMRVTRVRVARANTPMVAHLMNELTHRQVGRVQHLRVSYYVERQWDAAHRDLPWVVRGEGVDLGAKTSFLNEAQTQAVDASILKGLSGSGFEPQIITDSWTGERKRILRGVKAHTVAMDLAEMREMGHTPEVLHDKIDTYGGYWDKLDSRDKKRWSTVANSALRRLTKQGKLFAMDWRSPTEWALKKYED